jgi:hypothetical protein
MKKILSLIILFLVYNYAFAQGYIDLPVITGGSSTSTPPTYISPIIYNGTDVYLANSGVTSGVYNFPSSISVDALGRILSVTSGVSTTGAISSTSSSIVVFNGAGSTVGPNVAIGVASGYNIPTSASETVWNNKQPSGNYITALTGDVSASGPGSATSTVISVGGSSASNIHNAELLANAATSSQVSNTLVERDGNGDIFANVGHFNGDELLVGGNGSYGRTKIWNYGANAELRLGSLAEDGDAPGNIEANGMIVIGFDAAEDPMTNTTWGYARIKPDRFGLLQSLSDVQNYYFRVDGTELYLANDAGTKIFDVTRSTGAIQTSMSAGIIQSDLAGNLTAASFTAGSIPFANSSSTLEQDNAHLSWNDSTHNLHVWKPSMPHADTPVMTLTIDEGGVYNDHIGLALDGNPGEGFTIIRTENTGIPRGWTEISGGYDDYTGGVLYLNGNLSTGGDAGGIQTTFGTSTAYFQILNSNQNDKVFSVDNYGTTTFSGNLGVGFDSSSFYPLIFSPTANLDVNGSVRMRTFSHAGYVQADVNGYLSSTTSLILPIQTVGATPTCVAGKLSLTHSYVGCVCTASSTWVQISNGSTGCTF